MKYDEFNSEDDENGCLELLDIQTAYPKFHVKHFQT